MILCHFIYIQKRHRFTNLGFSVIILVWGHRHDVDLLGVDCNLLHDSAFLDDQLVQDRQIGIGVVDLDDDLLSGLIRDELNLCVVEVDGNHL